MRCVFQEYADADKDGKVDFQELYDVYDGMGQADYLTNNFVNSKIRSYDVNRVGLVEDDFVDLMQNFIHGQEFLLRNDSYMVCNDPTKSMQNYLSIGFKI